MKLDETAGTPEPAGLQQRLEVEAGADWETENDQLQQSFNTIDAANSLWQEDPKPH